MAGVLSGSGGSTFHCFCSDEAAPRSGVRGPPCLSTAAGGAASPEKNQSQVDPRTPAGPTVCEVSVLLTFSKVWHYGSYRPTAAGEPNKLRPPSTKIKNKLLLGFGPKSAPNHVCPWGNDSVDPPAGGRPRNKIINCLPIAVPQARRPPKSLLVTLPGTNAVPCVPEAQKSRAYERRRGASDGHRDPPLPPRRFRSRVWNGRGGAD